MIHFALGSIMNLSGKMNLEAAMVSGHL
jgi:hypothetical protein